MNTKALFRDYLNDHPSCRGGTQAQFLDGTVYREGKGSDAFQALLHSVRKGDTVRVYRPFLLAPAKGSPLKKRKAWAERAEQIKERGGCIVSIDPPLKGARLAMAAYEQIASVARGRAGQGKSGRPPKVKDIELLKAMTAIWCSRQYKTRNEALAALIAAGYEVTKGWCYTNLGSPDKPKYSHDAAAEPLKRIRQKAAYVYFIQDGRRVKIGHSISPTKRMASLTTHRKMTLLGTIPGGRQREYFLHKKFEQFLINGTREWFRLTPEIEKYIVRFAKRKKEK